MTEIGWVRERSRASLSEFMYSWVNDVCSCWLATPSPGASLAVEGRDAGMLRDDLVHAGVREGRLIRLVVPVPAEAEDVQDAVLAEALAELKRQVGHVDEGLRIVAVDVEDGHREHLGDVRREVRGTRRSRRGGEADLVVDDDVDGPAGRIALEVREIESLRDDALAGEGGVPVQQHGHDPLSLAVALLSCRARALPSTTGSTDSRWLALEAMLMCTVPPSSRMWSVS